MLDELQDLGLLDWHWDYENSSAVYWVTESGRSKRKLGTKQAEELVLLWRPPWDEEPVPTDVPILYEDEHLFAVNKPALLPVHPTARYHRNTLIKLLKDARPGAFVSLGHRLDRETSGVLICSKSPACDRALKKQIEGRAGVDKTYRAITWGTPDPARGARCRAWGGRRLAPCILGSSR